MITLLEIFIQVCSRRVHSDSCPICPASGTSPASRAAYSASHRVHGRS